ncbi:MAG: InlB B-repeat-containing protein [Cystobacterineae bacterium]|nr:InlB B-repeat-containing protein [Cystobacterineae bacterium]
MKTTQNLSPQRGFPLKRFSPGTLYLLPCVLLSAALSACPPPNKGEGTPLEEVYTVIFDKNGGDTEANPQSKTVGPHMSTIDALPEAPTREGYKFLGWNTQADGSGAPFTVLTPVLEDLTVYAQWGPPSKEGLHVAISPSTATLTPIRDGTYGEHSATFRVVVSGFDNIDGASRARLSIDFISGLSFEVAIDPEETTETSQTFYITVEYDGQTAFPESFATFNLGLTNISGYNAESRSIRMNIIDGQATSRAIPLNQANILAFNRYANTAAGLTRHYRLTENINLAEPAQPTESNWTAIGTTEAPFVGSLNGENHEFLRLRMRASGSDFQGLFGHIGEGATLENLRLIEASVSGNSYTGGLVGFNYRGTVQNSYATGNVTGSGQSVGGLVGSNRGTVQNSYATGSVNGSGNVGGLVGYNYDGTVQNCYATGSVSGSSYSVGGLVGTNSGTVQNSYATGSVTGNMDVGGLVGHNYDGTVQNCYATGSVNGDWSNQGGLVGYNSGTVHNSYATGSVTGNQLVGGLVGYNVGTVENSLALNPSVSSTLGAERVAGANNGTLTNNHAFGGMQNSAGSSTSWNNIGLNNLGGANISAGLLRRRDGFPAAFLTTPWTYVEGQLPGLLGQPVEMPAHIPQ